MMTVRASIVLLALAATTPEIRHFHYERALNGAEAHADQTCIVLDAPLYQHASPGLADVRLYRGDGSGLVETPYAIRQGAPAAPAPTTIPPLNLGRKGAQTSFQAEMPEGRYSEVDLEISAKDFVASVAVTGAQTADGREGTELGLYTIFDLTAQKLGRSTVLHLPESNFRYLYFDIQGPIKPDEVHGLSVERTAGKLQYVTVAETSQIAQKDHQTTMMLQVPAHVPVERVEFLVGDEPKAFSRSVSIQAKPLRKERLPSGTDAPGDSTSGTLLRLHTTRDGHRIDEEQLAVSTPQVDFGQNSSEWTVTVDNGDDTPLSIQSVRLEMAERQLCFDATAGATYTLFYGDTALSAPQYDYATLFAPEANATAATLGPEQANAAYQTRPDARPFSERHPALLWLALMVVVVVLGGVALRTAKSGGLKS